MVKRYSVTIRVDERTQKILDFVIAAYIEETGENLSYAKAIVMLARKSMPETIRKADAHLEKRTKTPSPDNGNGG